MPIPIFGFVQCFVAKYFCRICELSNTECKTIVKEIREKMRKKTEYESTVEVLYENDNIDYKETKGVKKKCLFNDLQNFHILDNCCVDVMHDIYEGIIPVFIHAYFDLIVKRNISTAKKLLQLCRDYNYQHTWKKYKPSSIKLEKTKLNTIGQNAMQNYCLAVHLPFILFKFKTSLGDDWRALVVLLQILQIVNSTHITGRDIQTLQDLIKEHLSYLLSIGVNLIAKHHFITHYPNLIRKIGPLIHSWIMRFESKHKVFTDLVHLSYNYKNLPLSLAKRHQERVCVNKNQAYSIVSEISKTSYDVLKYKDNNRYKSHLLPLINDERIVRGLSFIIIGSLELRPGLLLKEENEVYEIIHVISHNLNNYILCEKYNILQFEENLNSINIERTGSSFRLFDISKIKSFRCYDKVFCQGKT